MAERVTLDQLAGEARRNDLLQDIYQVEHRKASLVEFYRVLQSSSQDVQDAFQRQVSLIRRFESLRVRNRFAGGVQNKMSLEWNSGYQTILSEMGNLQTRVEGMLQYYDGQMEMLHSEVERIESAYDLRG